MKFYQRHPIIFTTEIVFIILYYASPVISLLFFPMIVDQVFFSVFFLGPILWLHGWMYIPLIIVAPFVFIIVVNTIVSIFDPIEEVLGTDDYSQWVKSGKKF